MALKLNFNLTIFVATFLLTLSIVVFGYRVNRQIAQPVSTSKVFPKEGYDFRQKRLFNPEYSKPSIGSKIDLSEFANPKGEKLTNLAHGELVLLVFVDPGCGACEASKDMINYVRKNTEQLGIKYFGAVLEKLSSDSYAQQYADHIGVETCFQRISNSPLPESLSTLGTPTHILTTSDGTVLQTWQGTDQSAAERQRMAVQISSDVALITEVVEAIQTK